MAVQSEQVQALAPDQSTLKAGRQLATTSAWLRPGSSADAIWGEHQGSGKNPYRTAVDLHDMATSCSCPSRKFPCKHALGLLLLYAEQSAALPAAPALDWVDAWLERRRTREQQRLAGKQAAPFHTPLPAPAPPEIRPICSATAARRLELLLADPRLRQIAEEWLQVANMGGLRVPSVSIPNLIEAGLRAASIQLLLLPVLGERAAWVAQSNPEWHYATVAALSHADALWQTGARHVRELWY